MGDFDCPGFNWVSVSHWGGATLGWFQDFKHDNFLFQKVLEPTMVTNVVDLIFSMEDDLVSKVVDGECLARSDHHMVWRMVGPNFSHEATGPMETELCWSVWAAESFRWLYCIHAVKVMHTIPYYTAELYESQCSPDNESRGNRTGTTELVPWGNIPWGEETESFYHAAQSNPPPRMSAYLTYKEWLSRKWCDRRRLLKSTE